MNTRILTTALSLCLLTTTGTAGCGECTDVPSARGTLRPQRPPTHAPSPWEALHPRRARPSVGRGHFQSIHDADCCAPSSGQKKWAKRPLSHFVHFIRLFPGWKYAKALRLMPEVSSQFQRWPGHQPCQPTVCWPCPSPFPSPSCRLHPLRR